MGEAETIVLLMSLLLLFFQSNMAGDTDCLVEIPHKRVGKKKRAKHLLEEAWEERGVKYMSS